MLSGPCGQRAGLERPVNPISRTAFVSCCLVVRPIVLCLLAAALSDTIKHLRWLAAIFASGPLPLR